MNYKKGAGDLLASEKTSLLLKGKMSSCEICKNYTSLKEPRDIGNDNYIYGFCFKDHHGNYGNSYPVYIPEGKCKSFKIKPGVKEEENIEGQMFITDFPEVMP